MKIKISAAISTIAFWYLIAGKYIFINTYWIFTLQFNSINIFYNCRMCNYDNHNVKKDNKASDNDSKKDLEDNNEAFDHDFEKDIEDNNETFNHNP